MTVVTTEQLDALEALAPVQPEPQTRGGRGGTWDLAAWLREHRVETGKEKSLPDGSTLYELRACVWNPDHSSGEAFVGQRQDGALFAGCMHNSCALKGWHEFRAAIEPGSRAHVHQPTPPPLPSNGVALIAEPDWGNAPLRELSDTKPAVPAMPVEMIPEPFRDWLSDITERMRVPLEVVAVAAIIGVATVVGRRVGIAPKRRDDWFCVVNLWGAVIAPPGYMKSAAIAEATRPIKRLEARAREQFEHDAKYRDERKAILKLEAEVLKEKLKRALKSSDATSEACRAAHAAKQAEIDADVLIRRRYITQDSTVEKLGELLRDNPNGLLLLRDEIVGWLRVMEKVGREGERQFYLEAWDGTTPFTFDRIERGTVDIPATCLSVLGGMQPGLLDKYVREATEGGVGADGLLQRLQLVVYPDALPAWENVDRYPDATARDRAFRVFELLDAWRVAEEPGIEQATENRVPVMRFADDAQELFDAWRDQHERRIRSDDLQVVPALVSHFAKYRSLMPSLALIFHVIAVVDGTTAPGPVSIQAAAMAADWCDFLALHALKVYASIGSTTPGRQLADRIEDGEVFDGMPLRAIYRRHWYKLDDSASVRAALAELEDLNWTRVVTVQPSSGRPSEVVRLHPQLRPRATGVKHG